MPGDLHCGGRRKLSLQIAVWVLAFGCSRSQPVVSDAASPDSAFVPNAQTRLVRQFAHDGLDAVRRLIADCRDRSAYEDARRNAAGSLNLWRRRLPMAAEAVFGAEASALEGAGAMAALDRAIESSDCESTHRHAAEVGGAFRLSELSFSTIDIPPGPFAQALSDAAYTLGQAVLESTPFIPEGDDSALADVLGLLDVLEQGTHALGFDAGPAMPALGLLRQSGRLSQVGDRALVVRETGVLGAAIRRAAHGLGVSPTLMIRPLFDDAEVSVLTLPRPAAPAEPARAELGRRLFFDRRLSRTRARSCATCHVPDEAFADGRVTPSSLDPATPLRRNTPTLLYAPVEALLTWDGRVRTADRQALTVIHTPAEMGLTDAELMKTLASGQRYADDFQRAFGEAVTPQDVGLALAAFESANLVPASSPIDRWARGDGSALSPDARAGLDVFAGKGRCARCHVPPVFAGSRPPDFMVPVLSVLGVPSSPEARSVDADRGRDGAFRVPTVRNVARTAPYFHHGRYASLEQVVDFYDRGGGRGLGLDVPNQDPEVRPLHLSTEEKRVLLVFMREALDDSR
jgi:cytochrome c peroxidase